LAGSAGSAGREEARVDTIAGLVARAVKEYGDREAIVDWFTGIAGSLAAEPERMTFAQLGRRVYWSAARMKSAGVKPGDRVAIWAPNSPRFVIAGLGAVTAGAILVPLNTRFKGEEAAWILRKSGASLLLVENGFLGNDYVAMLCDADPCLGKRPAVMDLAEFAEGETNRLPGTGVAPGDVADMFFTSGTTGKPKGVLCTHEQDVRVFTAWADGVGLRTGDRYLIVNPMFHTFGWKAGVLACLLRGATMIPQPVFDVGTTLTLIEQEQVTVLPGPPTLYTSILDHPEVAAHDISSLRLAVTGAASVPVVLIEKIRERMFREVVIAYGMTESCGTITVGDPRTEPELMARTVGTALAGTEVVVAGPDGVPVETGSPGEVLVRGYNVMKGYFEDPSATAEAIDADGWLHTGDVGILDAGGNLRITDRIKDMFSTGGFNVYPAEVEQVLARHPLISEAAVIGVPDERLGEVAAAFVVPRPGSRPGEDDVIGFCRERLANFKVPRRVVFVASLPRNAGGKVQKFILRGSR
jgi:HIP---CoA ligase